jgi:formylglycine-generating enzyme required for sulfatase activity
MPPEVQEIQSKAKKVYQNDKSYWTGKYTVTFAQYDRYCIETNQEKPEDAGWGRVNRPVIIVSWDDAKGYCEWLTVKYEFDFTLPTEAQWEKAARGKNRLIYTWGNEFNRWMLQRNLYPP